MQHSKINRQLQQTNWRRRTEKKFLRIQRGTFNGAFVLKNVISCLITLFFALSYLHFSHITELLTMWEPLAAVFSLSLSLEDLCSVGINATNQYLNHLMPSFYFHKCCLCIYHCLFSVLLSFGAELCFLFFFNFIF